MRFHVLLSLALHVVIALRRTDLNLPLSTREGSCTLFTATPLRKLLQTNGTADDFVHFTFCPNGVQDAILIDDSSNEDVLQVQDGSSDVDLDRVETSTTCQNITATFSFDRMVGTTVYTLAAVNESDISQILCSAQVTFVIVGFSIYDFGQVQYEGLSSGEKTPPISPRTVLSGIENEIISDYKQALDQPIRSVKIQVQFADGSSSETRSVTELAQELSRLVVDSATDRTSPIQFSSSNCDVFQALSTFNETNGMDFCGVFVTASQAGSGTEISLNLRYMPYKDGVSTLVFRWPELTQADESLEGEEYSNVVYVSVLGDPPPIVQEFRPQQRLKRTGGENITLVMDNVDGSTKRELRVSDQIFPEFPGSYHRRDDGLFEATYITQGGNGTELEWKLFVSFPEGTSRLAEISGIGFSEETISDMISYSTSPIEVREVSPTYGVRGDKVRLIGYFDGFKVGSEDHDVLLGTKALSALGVRVSMSENGDELSFELPARQRLGPFFEFPIVVVMGNESSIPVSLSYKPEELQLKINVYGSSYNEELDEYDLGGCAISRYLASGPSGVSEPEECEWRVSESNSVGESNLLDAYNESSSHSASLMLFPGVFGGREGRFKVSASCFISGEELESSVIVYKKLTPKIGVKLLGVKPRSVSVPDVPLRVSAVISPPRTQCYNESSKIVYKWTYENMTEEFSFRNWSSKSWNELSTPARLGREFIIPQGKMRPGNLTVSLHAYMEDEPSIFGKASTNVTVNHALLIPIIGYGASMFLHSVSMDLVITGERSYSPDEKYLQNALEGMTYHWTCKVSQSLLNGNSSSGCDAQFLPDEHASSFRVRKEALLKMRDGLYGTDAADPYFLQYTLRVEVGSRASVTATQTIEISPEEVELAQLQDLNIMDNKGNEVDKDRLRFFEDVMISPRGEDVSWKFGIVYPKSSSLLLKEPGNLILHPGYFDPLVPSSKQSLPLGVRSWSFSPGQDYELLISVQSSRPGVEPGEARITLKTENRPSLILSDLPVLLGDAETVFSAAASVNVDSVHDFQYFFYLVRADGDKYCLDGCGGSPYVQFRLTEAGSFAIHVLLMDMNGKTIFHEESFPQNITVSSESFQVSALSSGIGLADFDSMLRSVHEQGDHGTFELLSSSLASYVKNEGLDASTDKDVKVLDLAVDAMLQIVQNSAPTTMTSKSYVKTASRFVSMDSEYFTTQETMYTILSMVDRAVRNVPPTEAYDIQDELLEFYNLSSKHITRKLSASFERVRLQQFGPGYGFDAGSLLIDVNLLLEDHLTMVLSRDAQCGMIKHLKTVTENGVPPQDANGVIIDTHKARSGKQEQPDVFDILSTYENIDSKPSYSAFTLAVVCNPDQAKGIRGEATTFTWCDEVFTGLSEADRPALGAVDPHQKRLFTLLETTDFVSLSGKSADEYRTDTKFLVGINISIAAPEGVEALDLPDIDHCYAVNTSMDRLGVTSNRGCLGAEGYGVQGLGEPFEPKGSSQNLKNFSSVTTNVSTDGSSTILITASKLGLFGAVGKACPVSTRKPVLALPEGEDKEFVYFLFGGMAAALVGVGTTWAATSAAYVATAAAVAA